MNIEKLAKPWALTKVIDSILKIESCEQKYVVLKGIYQSEQLQQYMVIITIDQLLSISALYEHRCLKNIKKLYKSYGKCNDQQHYKSILKE